MYQSGAFIVNSMSRFSISAVKLFVTARAASESDADRYLEAKKSKFMGSP